MIEKPDDQLNEYQTMNVSYPKKDQKLAKKHLFLARSDCDSMVVLPCGAVGLFLVNLELACAQRFDLVGSLGDILGYLPRKFEGPSWSGLVTVGL